LQQQKLQLMQPQQRPQHDQLLLIPRHQFLIMLQILQVMQPMLPRLRLLL
jgi:hypothetical protein